MKNRFALLSLALIGIFFLDYLSSGKFIRIIFLTASFAALLVLIAVFSWNLQKRSIRYVAGLIMAVVIFQPALIFYIFNEFRDTLVISGLVFLSLAFLWLHHERIGQAWLLWPWLAYLLYNMPSALRAVAELKTPYTWITTVLAPGIFYLTVVEAGKFPKATLHFRRLLGVLALAQALVAMCVLFALVGTDWISNVGMGFSLVLVRTGEL